MKMCDVAVSAIGPSTAGVGTFSYAPQAGAAAAASEQASTQQAASPHLRRNERGRFSTMSVPPVFGCRPGAGPEVAATRVTAVTSLHLSLGGRSCQRQLTANGRLVES